MTNCHWKSESCRIGESSTYCVLVGSELFTTTTAARQIVITYNLKLYNVLKHSFHITIYRGSARSHSFNNAACTWKAIRLSGSEALPYFQQETTTTCPKIGWRAARNKVEVSKKKTPCFLECWVKSEAAKVQGNMHQEKWFML